MEFRILGSFEVYGDSGRGVKVPAGRERALLAVLLLRRGEVVSTDALVDALWGETPPSTATKALQGYVSHLRRLLVEGGLDGALETRSPGYILRVDDERVDAFRFEALAARGWRELEAEPLTALATFDEALALWRGSALSEFAFAEFAQPEIRRLDDLQLETVEGRIDAMLRLGRHEAVVAELRTLVEAHPLRERLRGQLMLALYRSGRQVEALEVYRVGRQILDRELGLEPDAELRRLEQSILTQDPALGRVERAYRAPRDGRRRLVLAVVVAALAGVATVAGIAVAARGGDAVPAVVPDSLVKIDVETNEIVDVVPVGREPGQVELVGPYVFVTSIEDKTLHRLDTRTGVVETSGAYGTDGAIVADGEFLWATSVTRGEAVRIHSESMAATQHVPLARDLLHAFVAVGGGSLWISQFPPTSVIRLSLRTHAPQRTYDLGFAGPPAEIAFAEGSAWSALGDALLRIDGRTGEAESIESGPLSGDPTYAFGSIWSGSTEQPAVWRTDPITGRTASTIRAGSMAFALAASRDSVWVTDYCDGTVSRIDPETESVIATVETGYHPKWLAVDHRYAWVGITGTRMDEDWLGCGTPRRP